MRRLPALMAGGLMGGCLAGLAAPSGAAQAQQGRPREPMFTQMTMVVYRQDGRPFSLTAARGYAGNKRVGFLQTALIPVVELEDVTIERVRADGTIQTIRQPAAVLDWLTKDLVTPDGKPLAENL